MSEYQEIQAQIAELQSKAAAIRATERAAALVNIKALMLTFEIKASELSSGNTSSSGTRPKQAAPRGPKVAPKYRDNAGNVWSGRGLQPRWLRTAIANGASVESFRIS